MSKKANSTVLTTKNMTFEKDIRIVIVSEGWVFIGRYSFNDKLNMVHLDVASCIRVWGTTAGLGQLALHGKQTDTVLDFAGVVDVPLGSVVATMRCDDAVWPDLANADMNETV